MFANFSGVLSTLPGYKMHHELGPELSGVLITQRVSADYNDQWDNVLWSMLPGI